MLPPGLGSYTQELLSTHSGFESIVVPAISKDWGGQLLIGADAFRGTGDELGRQRLGGSIALTRLPLLLPLSISLSSCTVPLARHRSSFVQLLLLLLRTEGVKVLEKVSTELFER